MQPFNLKTPDNETLYAWHILPIHLCREHEDALLNSKIPPGPAEDVTQTVAFKLLAEDPNARVVVSCEFTPHSMLLLYLSDSIPQSTETQPTLASRCAQRSIA